MMACQLIDRTAMALYACESKMMNATSGYYLSISGKEYGPYSVADLEVALAEDTITPECLVRPGIGGEWNPVIQVVGGSVKKPRAVVRRNTAYGSLRALIAGLSVVGFLILGAFFVQAAYQAVQTRELVHAIAAGQLLGWSLGVLVAWGLSNVLIDIADILAAERVSWRKAKPVEPVEA